MCNVRLADVHGNLSISIFDRWWNTWWRRLSKDNAPAAQKATVPTQSTRNSSAHLIISSFRMPDPKCNNFSWFFSVFAAIKAFFFVPTLDVVSHPDNAWSAGSMFTTVWGNLAKDSWTWLTSSLWSIHSCCNPYCCQLLKLYRRLT